MDSMSTVHADDQPTLSVPPLDQDTTELTTSIATATDRCPNCGARMAPDQRYCINCGERRTGGGLRDALPKTSVAAPPPRKRRGLTSSSSTNLIAGVATLLLALGVGVLIGRTGHTTSAKSTTPQVVTVQGAGTPAATSTTASSAATTAGAAATAKHAATKHKAHKAATHSTAVQKTAAKNGVKLPPPVVKVGSKCQKGAKGCQGGKFTGNFFGGG
jgi:zinc-ribbon domain